MPVVRAEAFNVVIHYIDSAKEILGSHNIESAVQVFISVNVLKHIYLWILFLSSREILVIQILFYMNFQELKIKSTHYQKEVIHAITTQWIGVVDGAAYSPNNVMVGIFIMVSSVEK